MRRQIRAFTLIELMLVVAIIGLLAAIAMPKFSNLVIKAREAVVKGKLGAVRSALSIYYAENEGNYPAGGPSSLFPRYMDSIPIVSHPTQYGYHPSGRGWIVGANVSDPQWASGNPWFFALSGPRLTGRVQINCTHTDSMGTTWSQW